MLSYSWWLRREGSGDYRAALAITIPKPPLELPWPNRFHWGQ